MIKMQDLAKYSALMLGNYISDMNNYTVTTMKQHQVMVVSVPNEEVTQPERNTSTEKCSIYSNIAPYQNNALFRQKTTFARLYHDANYYVNYQPRELDSVCQLSDGGSILSKFNFTPYLPTPYIEPTLATWKETTKKYWVLPVPIVKAFMSLLQQSMPDLETPIFCVYIILEDQMGVPDTTKIRYVTPMQFKNMFNYAGMQAIVQDVEAYSNNCLVRLGSLKHTRTREVYLKAFGDTPVTIEKMLKILPEPFLPISKECITTGTVAKVTDNKEVLLPEAKLLSYISNVAPQPEQYESGYPFRWQTTNFYPYSNKAEGLKYGKHFLDANTIIPTLKSAKSIPKKALMYATLSFSTSLAGRISNTNSPYAISHPFIWDNDSLRYIITRYGTQLITHREVLRLTYTDTSIALAIRQGIEAPALTFIIEISYQEFIDMLEYIVQGIMQNHPDLFSNGRRRFDNLPDILLYVCNQLFASYYNYNTVNIPDIKYYQAPDKFILGNPVFKRIHDKITAQQMSDMSTLASSPWHSKEAYDLATVLDLRFSPLEPKVTDASKRVISELKMLIENEYNAGKQDLSKGKYLKRTSLPLPTASKNSTGYLSTIHSATSEVPDSLGVSDLKDTDTVLALFAVPTFKDIVNKIGETGLEWISRFDLLVADKPATGNIYTHKDCKCISVDVSISIPHILMPYADIKVNGRLIPDAQTHLYSSSKYKEYTNTGKILLSRERAFLIATNQLNELINTSSLHFAIHSLIQHLVPVESRSYIGAELTQLCWYPYGDAKDRDYLIALRS